MADKPNRAQRRAQASAGRDPRLTFTADNIYKSGGGAIRFLIFFPKEMKELLASAKSGNFASIQLIRIVVSVLKGVQDSVKSQTDCKLCAACDQPLAYMYVVVVVEADTDDHVSKLAFAICGDCGNDKPSVLIASKKALRFIWPDSEIKTVTHPEGGHA